MSIRRSVAEGVYMLTGAGGNIGVSAGADGIVIIDDQYAPLAPKIQQALAKLSDQPARFVINTHWHGDHTGGNEVFGEAAAVIVAHDNVRKRLSEKQVNEFFKMEVPPSPKAALPIVTFVQEVTSTTTAKSCGCFTSTTPTPTATAWSSSARPMSCTWATPSSTACTRSSTSAAAARSTA